MKVRVHRERCFGHNHCVRLLPSVFEIDEQGYAMVRNAGVVPPGEEADVEDVVQTCPERALEIVAE
jgi:ferredoxin